MAFCKVCDCGNKIVFQRRLAYPIECPYCGRDTRAFEIYREDDPEVEIRLSQVRGPMADGEADKEQAEHQNFSVSIESPESRIADELSESDRSSSDRAETRHDGSELTIPSETDLGRSQVSYCLRLSDGTVIPIPDEGCVIGRTANGGEELAEYASVSRQHVRITPRRHSGVLVEDLSTFGTWLNGKKLEKNMPERATAGSKILLCNLETTLEYR